jgi:hypothetical protein
MSANAPKTTLKERMLHADARRSQWLADGNPGHKVDRLYGAETGAY